MSKIQEHALFLEGEIGDTSGGIIKGAAGDMLDATVESAVEGAMHKLAAKIDAKDVVKLETWVDVLLGLYMALPPLGRVYISQLFAKVIKTKFVGKSVAHNTAAAMFIEALDQGNMVVITALEKAEVEPEEVRAALLAKFGLKTDALKNWLEGKAEEIKDKVAAHGPGAHLDNHGKKEEHPAAPVAVVEVDPYLLIAAEWSDGAREAFFTLESGARRENTGTPKKADGSPMTEAERKWWGEAAGYMAGLKRNLQHPEGREVLRKLFERLATDRVTAEELAEPFNGKVGVVVNAIIGRKPLFSVANLVDTTDRFFGNDKPHENRSRWQRWLRRLIVLLIVVAVIILLYIPWHGFSLLYDGAWNIGELAAKQTGLPNPSDNPNLTAQVKDPILNVVIGAVLVLASRLLFGFIDWPFEVGHWAANALGLKTPRETSAPFFSFASLVTVICGGVGLLFTAIGAITAWGGGSAHLSLLACAIVLNLIVWGELLKRLKNITWPKSPVEGEVLSGEERKQYDTWLRYMIGVFVFSLSLAGFVCAVPYDGYVTKQDRLAKQAEDTAEQTAKANRTKSCAETTATLTAYAGQWDRNNPGVEPGTEVFCLVAKEEMPKMHQLCIQQDSLCR